MTKTGPCFYRTKKFDINSSIKPNSKQIKFKNKSSVFGIRFIALGLILFTIFGLTKKEDKASQWLAQQMTQLTSNPTMESDSIAYKIKFAFDNFTDRRVKPQHFKYYTTTNDDNALILVQIPNLHDIKQAGRLQAIDLVELITKNDDTITSLNTYIGIIGYRHLMVVKTPDGTESSRFINPIELSHLFPNISSQAKHVNLYVQ